MSPATRPPAHAPATALAMVLLDQPSMPDGDQIVALLGRRRQATASHTGPNLLELDVEGHLSTVGLLEAPMPWWQLEGPCATAWWWPQATRVCRATKAHLVVTAASKGDVFEANLRLTDVVAAVTEAAHAPAVYWGAGTLVHSGRAFCGEATNASREYLPLRLWVDFRVEPTEGDEVFFATTGLKTFGLMELECLGTRQTAKHVLDRMFNIAHYLCDRGPVLKNGNTIGLSPTERITAYHRASRWKRPGNVIFLALEG